MKINTIKEYEENAKDFESVSDEDLADYFTAIQDLYDRVSSEVCRRIMEKSKHILDNKILSQPEQN